MNVRRALSAPIAPNRAPSRRREPADGDFGEVLDLKGPASPAPAATAPAAHGDAVLDALDALRAPAAVRFSRHAAARLSSREATPSSGELAELGRAVDQLAKSGARESLVLLSENAYVVGVPSRTVITVMPRSEAEGQVFLHIDSTFVHV